METLAGKEESEKIETKEPLDNPLDEPVVTDTEKVESSNTQEEINKETNESNESTANPLMPGDDHEPVGLIKEDGEINWDCPCLQGMADGPCGGEFKDAFSCFHYSEEDPKGVDCLEQFRSMQECFVKYPEIYGTLDDDLEDEGKPEQPDTEENTSDATGSGDNTDNPPVNNDATNEEVEQLTENLANNSVGNS